MPGKSNSRLENVQVEQTARTCAWTIAAPEVAPIISDAPDTYHTQDYVRAVNSMLEEAYHANRPDADEVIVLQSSFDVDESSGDGSLNPGSSYSGWNCTACGKSGDVTDCDMAQTGSSVVQRCIRKRPPIYPILVNQMWIESDFTPHEPSGNT